jgi:hypothetical protein
MVRHRVGDLVVLQMRISRTDHVWVGEVERVGPGHAVVRWGGQANDRSSVDLDQLAPIDTVLPWLDRLLALDDPR